jgi:hypothetical protein
VDVLGGGYVVAPPSRGARRYYEFIQGGFADLADRAALPSMRGAVPNIDVVSEGRRNDELFERCMRAAHGCLSLDDLLSIARSVGASYLPPMDDAEIVRIARSAWGYTERGENWCGRGGVVLAAVGEVDKLASADPDAFALLAIVRRHHLGIRDRFSLANAMAESIGWTLARFRGARDRLVAGGFLRCLSRGGRGKGDPPIFAFPCLGVRNHSPILTDTPPL